ncbi:MAG: hypothetical protein RML37_02085, partial [Chitinophagales bacterium]|nr:hypothetical protein [Chitinophagales bacterium]
MRNIITAILFLIITLQAMAQETLPTRKVSIFKNGIALLIREGTAPLKNQQVKLPIPKQTIFGSYFIGISKDNTVKQIVFRNDTIKKKADCTSVQHYLAGNINKPVTIFYTPEEGIDKSASGKVTGYDQHRHIVQFATDAGKVLVLNANHVYAAEFKDPPAGHYMADSIDRVMIITLEKPSSEAMLQEIFMTNGINWLPSYFLKLKDDKNARLEMKAVLENYAEEIKNADVELVVGAPQMRYSQLDPMTYDYLTTSIGTDMPFAQRSQKFLQSNTVVAGMKSAAGDFFEQTFNTDGEKTGDMYIYKLGKISLPNNSKGSFPIFAGNVEYRDKYEATIEDVTNYYASRYVPN